MKSKTILGADGTTKMQEITVGIDTWERRRGRHKGSAAACRHDKQLKAV